jgi:hypothetical protein
LVVAFEQSSFYLNVLKLKRAYISKENLLLDAFLIKHKYTSWCIITAWNPFSIAQTKEVNEFLNEQLKADLSDYVVH